MSEPKRCDQCVMFGTCKLRLDVHNAMTGFLDFDVAGGGDWFVKLWEVLAERCIYFTKKLKA